MLGHEKVSKFEDESAMQIKGVMSSLIKLEAYFSFKPLF